MIATFTNASNHAPIELLVKGDWFDKSATITMGNIVVAQISRKMFNMREIFGGQLRRSSKFYSPHHLFLSYYSPFLFMFPVLIDWDNKL